MKVAWFHRFGGPEVLVYEDAPDPEPEPGEALMRVRAVGINHVDLDIRAGVSRFPISFPYILGLEYAGEVVAIRDRGSSIKEGDRAWVARRLPCYTCEFCLTGRDHLCINQAGLGIPGGYADLVRVPISALYPLPSHVSFEEAAASHISFGTAWHVLINRASLRAGQTVLIHSAGSGTGSAAIQVAGLVGATIITTASTDQKLQKARELGAHHLINYTQEDFAQKVLDLTNGRGVDIVVEPVGGEVFTKSLQCLKEDGAIIVIGGHGGEVIPLDLILLFRREHRLIGSRSATVQELNTVMGLVFEGKLKPVIHRTFPLSEAAEAHRVVDSRDIIGKVLLLP